jgi:hypothetical protein
VQWAHGQGRAGSGKEASGGGLWLLVDCGCWTECVPSEIQTQPRSHSPPPQPHAGGGWAPTAHKHKHTSPCGGGWHLPQRFGWMLPDPPPCPSSGQDLAGLHLCSRHTACLPMLLLVCECGVLAAGNCWCQVGRAHLPTKLAPTQARAQHTTAPADRGQGSTLHRAYPHVSLPFFSMGALYVCVIV